TGDFNADGKADILWQNDDGQAAIWIMDGLTPTSQAIIAAPPPGWRTIATGDFDGDGKADILWQYRNSVDPADPMNGWTAIWLMNGTTLTFADIIATPPPAWRAVGTGDLDGDGKSDVLWQYQNAADPVDPQNGQAALWIMNGTTPTQQSI